MDYELRIVVEKVSVSSQEVVKRDTLKIYDIQKPTSILDFGLRHQEQISLLSKIQNALLAEQSVLIDSGHKKCPKCGEKLSKLGFMQSKFHAVFSDHKVRMQKHRCKNPNCKWQGAPTTINVFGTDTHPDLTKLHCEQGAIHSYRDAQDNLEKLNCNRRSVNNYVQIQRITNEVGGRLSQFNLKSPKPDELKVEAKELIVQVDGGHIPTKDKNLRSFEAISGIVYRPSSLVQVDKHHRQIKNKSCVISALNDELKAIKTYLYNAALKQGLTAETNIVALADGASNCWSVISSLKPHCQTIEMILDWFHIGKKFQNVNNALGESLSEALESAKWSLWHGKADDARQKLTLLTDNITDEKKRSKLKGLRDYLENNRHSLVNYEERKQARKVFTSQVAESHIDSIINTRHKRKQKMQWTREGAHNVLQIRAMMTSNEWQDNWLGLVLPSAVNVA